MNEKRTPPGPDELRIRALNGDGVLFQERTKTVLKNQGFTLHTSEFGVHAGDLSKGKVRDSKLDLWFRLESDELVFNILVECKKAEKKLKEWVFFEEQNPLVPLRVDLAMWRQQTRDWSGGMLNVEHRTDFAMTGRELKGEWNNNTEQGDAWKTNSTRIEDACEQISIATSGITNRLRGSKDRRPESGKAHVVLPVIVTSASMINCKFEAPFFESRQTEIEADELSFTPIDSVIMRYALASHLQESFYILDAELSQSFVQSTAYKDILICNLESAANNIRRLCESVSLAYRTNMLKNGGS